MGTCRKQQKMLCPEVMPGAPILRGVRSWEQRHEARAQTAIALQWYRWQHVHTITQQEQER